MSAPHHQPPTAEVAIIGGSGFYEFLDEAEQVRGETPYGPTSGPVSVGTVSGRRVAFLPRHGPGHEFPPHLINYRANMWRLRSLGVRQVIAPCAVGGLLPSVAPGDFVVPDQMVDRTTSRVGTFVERGAVHVPFADPYCEQLGRTLASVEGVEYSATMVVIEGPRFSTRAESRSYAAQGWSLINMTGAPEAALAREMQLCYSPIAVVTDMDAGVATGEGVDQAEVFARFAGLVDRLKIIVGEAIGHLHDPAGCRCASWAAGLEITYDIPGPVFS